MNTEQYLLEFFKGVDLLGGSSGRVTIDLRDKDPHITLISSDGESNIFPLEAEDGLETAAEVAIGGELLVQLENYSGAEFIPIVGPTILRVLDGDDAAEFLEHLQEFKESGSIPELLANPLVQVADQCGLGRGDCGGTSRRDITAEDGTQRTTPVGPPFDAAKECTWNCSPDQEMTRELIHAGAARFLEIVDVRRALGAQTRSDIEMRAADGDYLNGSEGSAIPFLVDGKTISVDPRTGKVSRENS
ncbi:MULTISPECIES: hypothetical protein [Micrococcaceae]|uniref:hypothetical protein n=1 Tax=unclassified Kocuria TaxID=2649579 RepID=UPI001011A686|nr:MULTISPECIES: hypothetical protein [unclassified Kocuria]